MRVAEDDPKGGRPRLILCEGPDDAAFLRALIAERKLEKLNYTIRHNGTPEIPAGGIDKFGQGIEAYYEFERGPRHYRDLLLMADNDDTPDANFKKVAGQVSDYFEKAPAKPLETIDVPPRIMILMIPAADKVGNLESLCMPACQEPKHEASATTNFQATVKADQWPRQCRRDEMWLYANIAARAKDRPGIGLRDIFQSEKHRKLIPLNHKCFDPIEKALREFAETA